MKRNTRMQTERKPQNLTVTGSKGKNPWNDIEEPEPEFTDPEDQAPENEVLPERRGTTRLLTTIQIIACTAILAAAVALRLNGGEVYQNVRSWYFESLNDSIVADSQMDNIRHVVINLWSTISSSRAESSQAPSSAQGQSGGTSSQASSAAPENKAESGVSSLQENASAPSSSAASSQENAPNAPSEEENASSAPASS